MSPSDANQQPDVAADLPSTARPDPWGVKRAENLLTSLQGVLSARVEVSPVGEVTAVHVLTHAGTPPKQMVRNVESALLAQLGLKLDHRKISIAQTADVKPIEMLERSAVHDEAQRRKVVFRSIEIAPAGERRVVVRVTLVAQGDEASAKEEVADTPKARMQGAARAALVVLDRLLQAGTLELDAVKLLDEFDSNVVMVAVHAVEGRETNVVMGTAATKENPEMAAVLAVLDATNRWIQWRT